MKLKDNIYLGMVGMVFVYSELPKVKSCLLQGLCYWQSLYCKMLGTFMQFIKKLKEYRSGLVNYQKMFEDLYYNFRERNKDRFDKYQNLTDILFLGAYLAATTMDAVFTLRYIQHPADESHQFTSFMMESYGVPEGLLRTQGIEVLQLAGIVGLAYIIREAWLFYKGMEIDTEIRLGLMYTYMAIGISKHIHGILSWL